MHLNVQLAGFNINASWEEVGDTSFVEGNRRNALGPGLWLVLLSLSMHFYSQSVELQVDFEFCKLIFKENK